MLRKVLPYSPDDLPLLPLFDVIKQRFHRYIARKPKLECILLFLQYCEKLKDIMIDPAIDNSGRRQGKDRRKLLYSVHIPERRSGIDRRSGKDRRMTWEQKVKFRQKMMRNLKSVN